MSLSKDIILPASFAIIKSSFITKSQRIKMYMNFLANEKNLETSLDRVDFKPVVKIFTPDACCTWLISELAPDLLCFGLCDMGFGEPELGTTDLREIIRCRGSLGLPPERDKSFSAAFTLSHYAKLAQENSRIID